MQNLSSGFDEGICVMVIPLHSGRITAQRRMKRLCNSFEMLCFWHCYSCIPLYSIFCGAISTSFFSVVHNLIKSVDQFGIASYCTSCFLPYVNYSLTQNNQKIHKIWSFIKRCVFSILLIFKRIFHFTHLSFRYS